MITTAEFKLRFPEFASEDDALIQIYIDDAVVILNEAYWGTRYDLGLYYYTAHTLRLRLNSTASSGATVAQVARKAVDGTSVAYNISPDAPGGAWLNSTSYGQRYLELRSSLGVPAIVV